MHEQVKAGWAVQAQKTQHRMARVGAKDARRGMEKAQRHAGEGSWRRKSERANNTACALQGSELGGGAQGHCT